MLPIYLITIYLLPPILFSSTEASTKKPCTAAAIFLRANDEEQSTYTIPVTYPCDSSPLAKIEKLKKSVSDPFISFYLKKRAKRDLYKIEGSGGGGGGLGEDYDDDEDDDEEEDEDEEEEQRLNEIDQLLIEPSNHVIPVLPTPTFDYYPVNPMQSETPLVGISTTPVVTTEEDNVPEPIQPTPSSHFTTHHHTDDELVFALGSGDGPVVLSTPIYSTSSSSASPDEDLTYYSASSSSSSAPTPTLISSYLLHPIQKQMIYNGVSHTFVIPENTFHPKCEHYELGSSEPWVDVDGSVMKFFPTQNHISDYKLDLICQPYQATAEVYVSVRQRQKSRLQNHAFQLEFGMLRGNLSRVTLMNKIVEEINRAVGGDKNSSSNLVVLNTELDTYPFRLSYVNETIITNVCPTEELKRIYGRLQQVKGFMHLEKVTFSVPPDNNQCDSKVVAEVTGETSQRPHVSVSGGGGENYQPSIKNQIDRLNGTVGEYLVYHVKEDFCYDPEDGGTRNLKIELRNSEMGEVGDDYWLQFDSKNQEFYGLPMEVEERAFVLVCSDNQGKSANDVLELQIHPPRTPPTSYNTEFNLHFKSIPFTPKAIRKFIEKLSSILSPHIQVHSYVYNNYHVLFKWFNTTNPSTEHEVTEIRSVMLSDDGPVNKKLYEHFTPEFNVTVASVIPLRKLLSENNAMEEGDGGDKRYFDFDEVDVKVDNNNNNNVGSGSGGSGGGFFDGANGIGVVDSGYLTTYIIPSVLIAAMILLALIIACLLSRKNKYTQANTEDDSPNARVYLKNAKKGVPVIFQDELEEKAFRDGEHPQHRSGNIYEPPSTPRYSNNQPPCPPSAQHHPHPHHQSSTPTQSTRGGVISPPPTRMSTTPQPPDYQNSISRSMMRQRSSGQLPHGVVGGVGVYPGTHSTNQSNNPSMNRYNNIDAYAPPAPINYYGIHTSNSGGSGFSGSGRDRMDYQNQHQGPPGIISNSSKQMAPPPYVPP